MQQQSTSPKYCKKNQPYLPPLMNNYYSKSPDDNPEPDLVNFAEIPPTNQTPFIDVRSPSEYRAGHIPGAINVALFNDEERATVGTLYKRVDCETAIQKGIELATPKLSLIVQRIKEVAKNDALVYCWRGGMRSESICRLLHSHGQKARRLAGGYKAYRQHIRAIFDLPAPFIILGGYTGSGKTALLHSLEKENIQVLDLEGLANHKGSVFGHINEPPQPTSEQFENNLYLKFQKLNKEEPIILENESYSIGQVHLPEPLLKKMRSAPLIAIEVPKKARISRLVDEYGKSDREELIGAAKHLEKKLGNKNLALVVDYIKQNRFDLACDLLLTHYDAYYNRGVNKRGKEHVHVIPLTGSNLEKDTRIVKMKILALRDAGKSI